MAKFMSAYYGELEVQGGDFDLFADQLVIRDGEIAFMLSGVDGDGDFRAEGVAKLTNQGNHVASQVTLIYQQYSKTELVTIRFDVVKQTKKKLRCHIEGTWLQYMKPWLFLGNLSEYKPKQRQVVKPF